MEMEEASSSSQPACLPAWTQESIHVRGVPLSARDGDLKNHFERYGEVVWVADMHDVPWDSDGKAACVGFADPAAVNWALASWEKNNHIILGKMVEVACFSDRLQGKIEMYDLPPSATCSLLRDYFEKFGVVTEAYAAPNGWGCVVFQWDESAHEVFRTKRHLFCGTEVMVRRPSLLSNALLDTNVPQNDLGGATTPYDAPSYNQPTTAIPHTYNASTTSFSTSNNQWINATTNASDAPSFTPFGAPYTYFLNRPISATSCANTAPNTFFYDLAVRKENQIAESSRNNSNKGIIPNGERIFVGGLPTNITDDEFRAYFEKFGPITDAIVMKNKITNAPRGFGFVTFQTKERAREVLKNQFHELRSDKKVEVKIAICKSRNNSSSSSSNSVQNYNPTINNFPPSEYTPYTLINQTAIGYPQSICNYNYPYTWYHPIGYGPMGYGPMGLYYVNPNITGYDSQMQPADNFQNGGHYSNAYNNSINLSFRGYKGYTNGGNSTRVANLAKERASPSINTAETSKPRAADEVSDSNEEQLQLKDK